MSVKIGVQNSKNSAIQGIGFFQMVLGNKAEIP